MKDHEIDIANNYFLKILAGIYIFFYALCIMATWGGYNSHRLSNIVGEASPQSDFLVFYAASSLSLSGDASAVYTNDLKLKEETLAPFEKVKPRAFIYPPFFLLITAPLALIPFFQSLIIWVSTTLAAYLVIIRRIAPHHLTIWLTLAYSATFHNAIRGQNGFLSVMFLGGGLLLLERRPLAAGLVLGLMIYKPHLALLIPLALLAGHHWKALAGAIISTLSLAAVSTLIFGFNIWVSYLTKIHLLTQALQIGIFSSLNTTFFAASRVIGFSPFISHIIQWMVMAGLLGVVVWVWSKRPAMVIKGSVLVVAILLFSPYVMIYDLTLLALPLAWLGWEGHTNGCMPGEKIILIMGWLMPLLVFPLAALTKVHLAPFILLAILFDAIRRFLADKETNSSAHNMQKT